MRALFLSLGHRAGADCPRPHPIPRRLQVQDMQSWSPPALESLALCGTYFRVAPLWSTSLRQLKLSHYGGDDEPFLDGDIFLPDGSTILKGLPQVRFGARGFTAAPPSTLLMLM